MHQRRGGFGGLGRDGWKRRGREQRDRLRQSERIGQRRRDRPSSTGGGAAGGGCPSAGRDIPAASCSDVDVQTAIDSASNGDVVRVPGGTCTWSSTVNVPDTKGITVDGGGATITGQIEAQQNASVGTRITGFTFTSTHAVAVHGSTTSAAFRVDHDTFTSGDIELDVDGNAPGLVDHDTFTSDEAPNELIHNMGMGAEDASGWSDDVTPGGPDMVFIEDCTFVFNATGDPAYFWGSSAVQSYYGARTVFRHNTLKNCQVDQHGTPGSIGARWWEIYDNTFDTSTPNANQCCFIELRGGSGVVFDNHHVGANLSTGHVELYEEDTGYPADYQVGRGVDQKASPAYVWGNDADIPVESGSSNVEEGRDYFVSASQPPMLTRQQLASDSVSTAYTYTPYPYPHPLQCSP